MSCFSFHPRKSLTTGEGGMVLTDDDGAGGAHAAAAQPRHRARRLAGDVRRAGLQLPASRPQRRARARAGARASATCVARRRELAAALRERLAGVDGVAPQAAPDGLRAPLPGVRRDVRRRTWTATRSMLAPARARRGVDARHLRDARRAELPARLRHAAGRPAGLAPRSPSARSRCRCTRAWPTRTSRWSPRRSRTCSASSAEHAGVPATVRRTRRRRHRGS